jgi:ATP-dependent protease HslVU (ClpYQ) peptidase subunit
MTTIAFDGRYLASDGRCTTGDGMIVGRAEKKLHELAITINGKKTRAVIGCSGNVINITALLHWLSSGGDFFRRDPEDLFSIFGIHPDPQNASIGIVIVTKEGEFWLVTEEMVPFSASLPLAAGSGTPFAMTAMSMGVDAVAAVNKAIEFDSNSGGKLRCFDTVSWKWVEPEDLREIHPAI